MKDRPILFSAPMVRAILNGSKTQTRRVVKCHVEDYYGVLPTGKSCPYGQPGDSLWVREAFLGWYNSADGSFSNVAAYRADGYELQPGEKWLPSIHMPRAASRITLEVTGVRVERLQDISRGDAMAEGCPFPNMAQGDDPRKWYADLWHSINGPDSWILNPWVWVVEFKVMKS